MAQLTSPLKLLLVSQPVCVEPFFLPPTVPDLKFPACWDKKRWVRTHFVGYLRKSIRVWESCIAPSRWQLGPATFKWPVILPIWRPKCRILSFCLHNSHQSTGMPPVFISYHCRQSVSQPNMSVSGGTPRNCNTKREFRHFNAFGIATPPGWQGKRNESNDRKIGWGGGWNGKLLFNVVLWAWW